MEYLIEKIKHQGICILFLINLHDNQDIFITRHSILLKNSLAIGLKKQSHHEFWA